jgi:PAS domain-containing protein
MRHRKRGVSLQMFLGLMKYYRQSYIDLIKNIRLAASVRDEFELFINRVFDRIEISFCVEWSGARENQGLQELQIRNRLMTNEKNKYLTIFESIPNPIIMLDREMNIDNMNYSAARLFKESLAPGSQYYHLLIEHPSSIEPGKGPDQAGVDSDFFSGVTVSELLPWLKADVEKFHKDELGSAVLEKQVYHNDLELVFRVKFSKSLDISGKFEGTIIILEDITSLKNALTEVKTLRGFLPICSHCKNVRDDEGYWQKVEEYVQDRSEAAFSHSICPDCAKKYYPYLKIYDD